MHGKRGNSSGGFLIHKWTCLKSIQHPLNIDSTSIQQPFKIHSTAIKDPFNIDSTSIQQPFNIHSTSIKQPFNIHSTSIQRPFNIFSSDFQNPFQMSSAQNPSSLNPCWLKTGFLYWIIVSPNILGSILQYNHQPTENPS